MYRLRVELQIGKQNALALQERVFMTELNPC